ncbi:MAG: 50S ribosomal protein L10 [Opitutae bacterium]|nr:50S ribosomal protein L10 [Opitutae bacterium]
MRSEKKFLIDEVAGHLAKSNYLILADFTHVTVVDAAKIRASIREFGAEYHVVKNSILNIAAKGANLPEIAKYLTGHTAIVTGGDNPSGVAKALFKFFSDTTRLEIKGGVVEGALLDKAALEELSKLPSLAEIRALFLSLLSTPAGSFVRVLVAKNDKEGGEPSTPEA